MRPGVGGGLQDVDHQVRNPDHESKQHRKLAAAQQRRPQLTATFWAPRRRASEEADDPLTLSFPAITQAACFFLC